MKECSKLDRDIKKVRGRIQVKRDLIIHSRKNCILKEGVKEEIDKLEKEVAELKKELIRIRFNCIKR